MSQAQARDLLLELGGRATTAQIRELAKRRYPNTSLYSYVTQVNLRAMEKYGEVRKEGEYWILNKSGKKASS